MDQRPRRSPARWLAPLALIAILVAFAAVVSGSNGGAGTSSTTSATQSGTHAKKSGRHSTAKTKVSHRRFYTVKVGDSLSSIADKTGVSLATIQALNPNVDSTQMTAGQKIRLR